MTYLLPSYFLNLGLDQTATERDIKRAYAAKLRTIDQATQAVAFGQLRQDYEAALNHVKSGWGFVKIEEISELPLKVSQIESLITDHNESAAYSESEPAPNSYEVAQKALTDLAERLISIAPSNDAEIEAEIKRTLENPVLIDLQIRQDFEALLVKELAARRYTHSTLFTNHRLGLLLAADSIYGWSNTTNPQMLGLAYLQTLLDEIDSIPPVDLAAWLMHCDQPNPDAFKYLSHFSTFKQASTDLIHFSFNEGHLEAWYDIHERLPEHKGIVKPTLKFLAFLVWFAAVLIFIAGKGLYPSFAIFMTAVMGVVLAL
jgi:hypothetical protein